MLQAPLLALVSLVATVGAGECRPPKNSSEAKLLAAFAAPLAFSPAGNAGRVAPGTVRLSFDLTYDPTPSADIRRASFCQRKSENTELSPVFPRPRLALGLPGGWAHHLFIRRHPEHESEPRVPRRRAVGRHVSAEHARFRSDAGLVRRHAMVRIPRWRLHHDAGHAGHDRD